MFWLETKVGLVMEKREGGRRWVGWGGEWLGGDNGDEVRDLAKGMGLFGI